MAFSVVMPALEMAQETGKLIAWRKKEGDTVRKGEPLLDIETDKAVVEIEAPGDGVLAGVSVKEGGVVPVGQTIAWLVQPGEAVPRDREHTQSARRVGAESAVTAAAIAGDNHRAATPTAMPISPKARRLAQERGVDLTTIKGSGAGGEILAADIESATANQSAIANRSDSADQSAIRSPQSPMSSLARIMAERTTHSWTTAPHFFVERDVDATSLKAVREKATDLTHTDVLVAIVARTLTKHPRMNARWEDGVRANTDVNVAIAIAVEDGVVAAVIHHADRAPLGEIAARRKELVDRARAGRLRPADISRGTFTISNLGMYNVDRFTAIIVPPQAGILAVGAVTDRVIAVDGKPQVKPMMTLTLSCDHRVVDGARAAAFLNDLADAIANCV
jgi:pyruvate dehydrogenase E2 component (dihydrolipoamide acetyltransferase)